MKSIVLLVSVLLLWSGPTIAAYHHGGDTDSELALAAFPESAGTKLDNCALCHTGGEYEKKPGVWVSLGSCQWCHYSYGYDQNGDIASTLNSYGEAFNDHGKSAAAFAAINGLDSDGDDFANGEEIAALRYPGNANDDPTKVAAPFKVFTLAQLEAMPAHTQIMLMNTHKSGDFYAEYTGVTMARLLKRSKILDSATGITAFAPDGWAQYHPLEQDDDPLMYHVYGTYPQAPFYYDEEADQAISTVGWCDYSAPSLLGLEAGAPIPVRRKLRMLLAFGRDGYYLEAGELTEENKLDGEGPFRVVPPQKLVGPPDQSVKSDDQNVIWPFDNDADHNAGFATRSATIIKVEPLPVGTTDIDIMEAGWDYVDSGKVVVYGAIDPVETVKGKIRELSSLIRETERSLFAHRMKKQVILKKLHHIKRLLRKDHDKTALSQISQLIKRFDGCQNSGSADNNDWLTACNAQQPVYWRLTEIKILLEITD